VIQLVRDFKDTNEIWRERERERERENLHNGDTVTVTVTVLCSGWCSSFAAHLSDGKDSG
jgi:hypothetical protein